MNDELKKAVQKSQVSLQKDFPKERAAFKGLLLANPNYFGTLAKSPFTPVLPVAGNTFYEELGCVGYHPQQELLEGVVYVYQPSGYGGDACGPGSAEFVRFYLSFDNGATWADQGMTSFQAYDVPAGTDGSKRLEYAVSLKVNPRQKRCTGNHLILTRAILSWNNPPPANQPNWTPVWGNVREATIQVEPRKFIIFDEIFKGPLVSDLGLAPFIDAQAQVPLKKTALGAAELAVAYKEHGVPVHRFAFKELTAFASGQMLLSAEAFGNLVPGVALDPDAITKALSKDGDTSYEELTCIGLDPNSPDALVGVIKVKKSAGYSGGPCTEGSREYVTFWADTDGNGTFDTCLGTASVGVYDLAVPPQGVHYAVRLPVDLSAYRQACAHPRVMRIRAILSWSVAPPCANPNYVPTWGNREETLIHIAPTVQVPGGRIAILGGIPVSMIDDVTGLTTTTPVAKFALSNLPADSLGRPCPFGARVSAQGLPIPGWSYLAEVRTGSGTWAPLVTDLVVVDGIGNTAVHTADNTTKRFTYLPFTQNVNNLLAQWDTAGDALWQVRLTVFDGAGVPQGSPDVHVMQLDNTGPEASIEITSGAGNCGKFASGSVLAGRVVATDAYLASYAIGVDPNVNDPGEAIPVPSGGVVNTAPAPGDAWSLDTMGMRACGYVIRVVASDRAILNNSGNGHTTADSAGFCLDVEG